jgi:CelD/BcsL family acetyltransferase involved in cellulose biosynthesis
MPLAVDWIDDQDEFLALAAEWDGLLQADSQPFDLHCWYSAWWEAFGGAGKLAVCTVRRDGKLVAACPLSSEGARLKGLANSHSGTFRPLAKDEEAMAALIAAICEHGATVVELEGLPAEDPCMRMLEAGAGKASRSPLTEPSYISPIVETDGDFDAWRKQSKARWGAPLERFRRKMGREHEARFEIVEAPRDLDAELDDGFRVEASGWKGEAGTAILSTPETELFYRRLAKAFDERGGLRFSRIVLDGETIAFDFCLLHRDRLYLQKTGYDERFRRLAPGLVLRLSVIERCFELGLPAHELLGSATEWKLKFANAERSHVTFRAYRGNPSGLAQRAYRRSVRPALRSLYRRVRPRRR